MLEEGGKMDRSIFLLSQHIVSTIWLELCHVDAHKMPGFDILFLLGFRLHLRKIFSVLKLLLAEVVRAQVVCILPGL